MKVSKAALYSALAIAVVAVVLYAAWNPGQQSAEERPYYQGKNLNVILGLGPSAGGTAIGRLVSKHLVEHIPGKPRLVVKNMEGAELMKAHQYVLRSAPKDGTVIYYGPRSPIGEMLDCRVMSSSTRSSPRWEDYRRRVSLLRHVPISCREGYRSRPTSSSPMTSSMAASIPSTGA